MTGLTDREVIAPSDEERETLAELAVALGQQPWGEFVFVGDDGAQHHVPISLLRAMAQVVQSLNQGQAVAVLSVEQEIDFVEAAALLQVSEPYLRQLLATAAIPFRQADEQPYIRLGDLLAYRRQRSRRERAALRELTHLSEELGMYDEDFPKAPVG